MIRRSRISVRPNVRPGSRSALPSQDISVKYQETPSNALDNVEQVGPTEDQTDDLLHTVDEKTKEPKMTVAQWNESSPSKKTTGIAQRKAVGQPMHPKQCQSFARKNADESACSLSPTPRKRKRSQNKSPTAENNGHSREINDTPSPESNMLVETKNKVCTQSSVSQLSSDPKPVFATLSPHMQCHSSKLPDVTLVNTELLVSEAETDAHCERTSLTRALILNEDCLKKSQTMEPGSFEKSILPSSQNVLESSISKPLNCMSDRDDVIRLSKARKLQEILKKETFRELSQNMSAKAKRIQYDTQRDHSKMTMRELIYYLPKANPMRLEEKSSPPKQITHTPNPVVEEEQTYDALADMSDSESSEQLLVPQVKVGEDGSLIIDEESLTVEVQRAKGPNITENEDPIFEHGSTTTYSSFRKGSYTKPWSSHETDMFFLAISMVGTDFSMIGSMFPHRARSEIKNKFKKEERANCWRIDKAFREKRRLDLDFFKELLDKVLADDERKKSSKGKSSTGAKRQQRLVKGRKRVRKSVTPISGCKNSTEEDAAAPLNKEQKQNEDHFSEQTPSVDGQMFGSENAGRSYVDDVAHGDRSTRHTRQASRSHHVLKRQTGLVTLRASVSEEEMENQEDSLQDGEIHDPAILHSANSEDQNQIPAFVPLGLRSPIPGTAVAVDTVEEGVMDFIEPENLEVDNQEQGEQTIIHGQTARDRLSGVLEHASGQTMCKQVEHTSEKQTTNGGEDAQLERLEISDGQTDATMKPDELTIGRLTDAGGDSASSLLTSVSSAAVTRNASEALENIISTETSTPTNSRCEEPVFIISLTEISSPHGEVLSPDASAPNSTTQLPCHTGPLPFSSEVLSLDTQPLASFTVQLSDKLLEDHPHESTSKPAQETSSLWEEPQLAVVDSLTTATQTMSLMEKQLQEEQLVPTQAATYEKDGMWEDLKEVSNLSGSNKNEFFESTTDPNLPSATHETYEQYETDEQDFNCLFMDDTMAPSSSDSSRKAKSEQALVEDPSIPQDAREQTNVADGLCCRGQPLSTLRERNAIHPDDATEVTHIIINDALIPSEEYLQTEQLQDKQWTESKASNPVLEQRGTGEENTLQYQRRGRL